MHGTTDDLNRHTKYSTTFVETQVPTDNSAFQFSVLQCKGALLATKVIFRDKPAIDYSTAARFRYTYYEQSFGKFVDTLVWLSGEPQKFMIRGQLKPEFNTGEWHRRLIKPKPSRDNPAEIYPATIETSVDRRWCVFDLDDIEVPHGLGAGDKLIEAGYYIRDQKFPMAFRQCQCIISATARTGISEKGLSFVRARLWFQLSSSADNDLLELAICKMSYEYPDLKIDQRVMTVFQPIYTARPKFVDMEDPVPVKQRVAILEGIAKLIPTSWFLGTKSEPNIKERRRKRKRDVEQKIIDWGPMDPELEKITATDAALGLGVSPIETTRLGWREARHALKKLDHCPVGKRFDALREVAWKLASLYFEGEMSEEMAREIYARGAKRIVQHGVDHVKVQSHIDDAFIDGRTQ